MGLNHRRAWNVFRFLRSDRGASAVEYGLLVALIALGSLIAFQGMGNGLVSLFGTTENGAGAQIENAASAVDN
ncbi:MAG: Flp family type IVb pilin [Hyphomicrobiaceae bacterium]|nr:Flp family type IVb pilin [Hyphomicrobiaceae bacterium]